MLYFTLLCDMGLGFRLLMGLPLHQGLVYQRLEKISVVSVHSQGQSSRSCFITVNMAPGSILNSASIPAAAGNSVLTPDLRKGARLSPGYAASAPTHLSFPFPPGSLRLPLCFELSSESPLSFLVCVCFKLNV